MYYRQLGTDGPLVSEIALGTWRHVSTDDQPAADRLVRTALDLGVTLFDTAASYDNAQEALGRALAGVPEEAYVLSTKVYYGRDGTVRGLSRTHLESGVDTCLRALRTGRIGLVSAHRFDPDVPLVETVEAFGALIAAGKVGHWGVSEWTSEQIGQACALADELGVPRPVANQPQYSVLWRVPEGRVLPACRQLGLGTVAFWPLAQGVLTGKYRPGSRPAVGTRAGTDFGRATMHHLMVDPLLERVELFARLARRHGMNAAGLAVAWVLSRCGVTSALVGASAPEQLADSVAASGVGLSGGMVELIDTIFAGCVHDDVTATG